MENLSRVKDSKNTKWKINLKLEEINCAPVEVVENIRNVVVDNWRYLNENL